MALFRAEPDRLVQMAAKSRRLARNSRLGDGAAGCITRNPYRRIASLISDAGQPEMSNVYRHPGKAGNSQGIGHGIVTQFQTNLIRGTGVPL